MPLTDEELPFAWCAGFFDGEGHAGYHRGYPSKYGTVSRQLAVNVSQSVDIDGVLEPPETLVFFQSTVGFGKISGPFTTKRKHKYVLVFRKREAPVLFAMLEPYLLKKKADDFRRAFEEFRNHDRTPTIDDWERYHKLLMKKKRNE